MKQLWKRSLCSALTALLVAGSVVQLCPKIVAQAEEEPQTGGENLSSTYESDSKQDGNDEDEWKPVVIDPVDWMKNIADERILTDVNISGTHDSATANLSVDFVSNPLPIIYDLQKHTREYATAQWLTIPDQLNNGVRFLDIRASYLKTDLDDAPDEVFVGHGPAREDFDYMGISGKLSLATIALDENNQYMKLEKPFEYARNFLEAHPTETVLVQVGHETGDETIVCNKIKEIIEKYSKLLNSKTGEPLVYMEGSSIGRYTHIPTMGEVRGKMFIIETEGGNIPYGLDLNTSNDAWYLFGETETGPSDEHSTKPTIDGIPFYYENHWDCSPMIKSTMLVRLSSIAVYFHPNEYQKIRKSIQILHI